MHNQTRHLVMGAALLLTLVGCGELADQDSKPPVLATFQGSLRLATNTTQPAGKVRLALIWQVPEQDGMYDYCSQLPTVSERKYVIGQRADYSDGRYLLGTLQQAVDISPQFPSAFKLEVTEPPPPEAFYENDDGVHVAEGKLVAYRDGNANGKLDPHTEDASSPDEVLSTELGTLLGMQGDDPRTITRPWAYGVWYLDRPHQFTELLDLKAGYNVLAYKEYGAKPVDELELELLPTPALQVQLCSNECVIEDHTPIECPDNPAAELVPPPADAQFGYMQNGKAWTWKDGPDSFVFEARHCIQNDAGFDFSWRAVRAEGCSQRRIKECHYGPEPTPSPKWPCDSYSDLRKSSR